MAKDPGALPSVEVARYLAGLDWPTAVLVDHTSGESGVTYHVWDDLGRGPFRVRLASDEQVLMMDRGALGWVELRFEQTPCPFRMPAEHEITDGPRVLARSARTVSRPKTPRGYQVMIQETESGSEEEEERYPWTLQDYELAAALGTGHCVDAQELIRDQLRTRGVRLSAGVVFDSEIGCFFAYTRTAEAAGELAQFIADLVAEHEAGQGMP